jgi:hypothetical protein
MKNIRKILFLFLAVSLFTIANSQAQQIIVKVHPARPRGYTTVRPARPSPHHVWVAEEWRPSGSTYAYQAGHWEVPPHNGAVWVPGYWKHHASGRGDYWVAGHWSR